MTRRSSSSLSTNRVKAPGRTWGLWILAILVLVVVALPAFFAGRQPTVRHSSDSRSRTDAVRDSRAAEQQGATPSASSPDAAPPHPPASVVHTRATTAWELSNGSDAGEAAAKMHVLLRAETDERVRCEIIGAASTLDTTPALHRLFEESAEASQPSRVRQVALDLWLTVYPDEAPAIARRFLTDQDEEVRGVAEDYFLAKKEEAKGKSE